MPTEFDFIIKMYFCKLLPRSGLFKMINYQDHFIVFLYGFKGYFRGEFFNLCLYFSSKKRLKHGRVTTIYGNC